ncbi:hypothetical protein [Flavobacterium sp.]|uniref:hypothetical protein n=1 Tax=Flavobacterium sp. TaxID=239 RepID=UPI002611EF30|nr:hypothetical protein [Flavobacterium sp.]
MGKFKFNITMLEYSLLNEEDKDLVDYTVKNFIKSNKILRVKKFFRQIDLQPKVNTLWELSWEDLLLLRSAISKSDIDSIFNIVYELKPEQMKSLEVFNVFASFNWISDELKAISNAEMERLHSELTNEEKEAGAEELIDYGYYSTLKAMCPDLLKHNEYLKLSYSIVFRDMAHTKLINKINKKYNEIIAHKNKPKRK